MAASEGGEALSFPLLLFSSPQQGEDEQFYEFRDAAGFGSASPRQLRVRVGGTIIDNAGQTWLVRSAHRTGTRSPLLVRILAPLFGQEEDVEHQVEYELAPLAPIPFSAVRRRVQEALLRDVSAWDNPDAVDGVGSEAAFAAAQAAVGHGRTVGELFAGLEKAWALTDPSAC